jgi:hypothetical protein
LLIEWKMLHVNLSLTQEMRSSLVYILFFEVKLDFVKRTLESFQQVAPDFSQFFILHVEFEVLQLETLHSIGWFFPWCL